MICIAYVTKNLVSQSVFTINLYMLTSKWSLEESRFCTKKKYVLISFGL